MKLFEWFVFTCIGFHECEELYLEGWQSRIFWFTIKGVKYLVIGSSKQLLWVEQFSFSFKPILTVLMFLLFPVPFPFFTIFIVLYEIQNFETKLTNLNFKLFFSTLKLFFANYLMDVLVPKLYEKFVHFISNLFFLKIISFVF